MNGDLWRWLDDQLSEGYTKPIDELAQELIEAWKRGETGKGGIVSDHPLSARKGSE